MIGQIAEDPAGLAGTYVGECSSVQTPPAIDQNPLCSNELDRTTTTAVYIVAPPFSDVGTFFLLEAGPGGVWVESDRFDFGCCDPADLGTPPDWAAPYVGDG